MRLNIAISAIAMLATAVSGHTVKCWSSDWSASVGSLEIAVAKLHSGADAVGTDGNSCVTMYCGLHNRVKYCDRGGEDRVMPMQNIIDGLRVIDNECQVEWEGSTLAGGLVDHSDYWSVDGHMIRCWSLDSLCFDESLSALLLWRVNV